MIHVKIKEIHTIKEFKKLKDVLQCNTNASLMTFLIHSHAFMIKANAKLSTELELLKIDNQSIKKK